MPQPRIDQLELFARQHIPSVKAILDEVQNALSPSAGSFLSDTGAQSLSELEVQKIQLLSEQYQCDLKNDMAQYRQFREGHVTHLSKWHTALEEHKKQGRERDRAAASSFLSKYLKLIHIDPVSTKADHFRNEFVKETATFMKSVLGDVPDKEVAEVFVIDLRSQGALKKKLLEMALTVSMAYPNALKLISEPVLCRHRPGLLKP